jgi:hypothetical protein
MVPMVGAFGFVITVDELDELDIPPELVVVTANVYAVFAVNPNTIIDVDDDVPVPINPPGLLVTV